MRFYFDDILVNQPEGWPDIDERIRRTSEFNGILEELEANLTFSGDAYHYLLNKKLTNTCSNVAVRIESDCAGLGTFTLFHEGLIFISQVEFNRTKHTARVGIVDNNISSRVWNNKSLPFIPTVGRSKNDTEIDPCNYYTVDMFNPCTGNYSVEDAFAFRVFDLLEYAINFMTDGRVGFRSSLFDFGGSHSGKMLTTGRYIKNDPDARMTLTFDKMISEINKKINIGITIDTSGTKPVVVIESFDDLFNDNVILQIENVGDLIEQISQEDNYSSVTFGSGDILVSGGCPANEIGAFPDEIDFLGCKDEEFIVLGDCNIDRKLELKGNWIVSSNIIENICMAGDDSHEDDIIWLDTETVNSSNFTAVAVKTDVFGTTLPVFYNADLFNSQVANRHLSGIPNSIAQYFAISTLGFKAAYTQGYVIGVNNGTVFTPNSPVWFHDDNTSPYNDPSNNYGNGTAQGSPVSKANSRYTCPINTAIKFRIFIEEFFCPDPAIMRVFVAVYDSSDTLKYKVFKDFGPTALPESVDYITPYIYMKATDYAIVEIQGGIFVNYDKLLTFETYSILSAGGVFAEVNPENYLNNNIKVKVPMTRSDWNALRANKTSKVSVSDGETTLTGHIKDAKYNQASGLCDLILLSNGK